MANTFQHKVLLKFQADTSDAVSGINRLITSLQTVASKSAKTFDTSALHEASSAALELQNHLQNAINVDTGRLDLTKLGMGFKKAGHDLEYFRSTLTAIGPDGQRAFNQLVASISNAEASSIRLTGRLSELWATLKNTARWQISSSILMGLTSSIKEAYNYAQDLNKSLTNIAIVTGQSTDQLTDFAKQANIAAQRLNASTKAYTDASLIFFQQGLKGDDVLKRADTVIKLSNVTGDAVANVANQMTAIWNNFAKGSENLELFADKITALGAATASSSALIVPSEKIVF